MGRAVLVFLAVLAAPAASFAQLNVITSGGFSAAWRELSAEFEKASGLKVNTGRGASQGDGPNTIGAQLRRGVPEDVAIMSREGLDALIGEGRMVKGTEVDLARTPLGVSVRAGAKRPEIGTVEAFKQAMLNAKSVTFPSSTTGIYLVTKLFPQLGIAGEMAGKISNAGVASVVTGEAEIAIQPVSELLHVAGADYVGTIPQEIQYISVFSAAVVSGAKDPAAAKRLIAFLASEKAAAAIRANGMEPVTSSRTSSR